MRSASMAAWRRLRGRSKAAGCEGREGLGLLHRVVVHGPPAVQRKDKKKIWLLQELGFKFAPLFAPLYGETLVWANWEIAASCLGQGRARQSVCWARLLGSPLWGDLRRSSLPFCKCRSLQLRHGQHWNGATSVKQYVVGLRKGCWKINYLKNTTKCIFNWQSAITKDS